MRLLRKAAGPGIRSRTGHLDDSVSIDFDEYALVYGKGSKIVRHAFSAVASLHQYDSINAALLQSDCGDTASCAAMGSTENTR